MLTNWGDLLTNVPASGTPPALTSNTLTAANAAARLALVYGNNPDANEVGLGDVVLQTDTTPATVWVLAGADPSVAGNWRRTAALGGTPTSGTLARFDSSGALVDSKITEGGTPGTYTQIDLGGLIADTAVLGGQTGLRFQIGGSGKVEISAASSDWYVPIRSTQAASFGGGGSFITPEAPLHSRSATGPQEIWEYADNVDARITVDASGNAVILASGNISLNGDNRATYDASPSATTIRDILISFGLMAAS